MSKEAWVMMPRQHAQALLNDLNARIDQAHPTVVPVFAGIVALHDALMRKAASSQDEEVERLAQFLHDEGGFADAMTGRTWPEHEGDTGQRGEGWVKIVPSDVAANFRDVARRWLLPRASLTDPVGNA